MAGAGPVPKKKKNPLIFVAIGCVALMMLSCIGWTAWAVVYPLLFSSNADDVAEALEAAAEAAEAEAEAAEAEEESAAGDSEGSEGSSASGGGDTVCSRAQACCEAYVNELSGITPGLSVQQTCAGVSVAAGTPMADASCQSMIDGWRQALSAIGRAVPSSCQ